MLHTLVSQVDFQWEYCGKNIIYVIRIIVILFITQFETPTLVLTGEGQIWMWTNLAFLLTKATYSLERVIRLSNAVKAFKQNIAQVDKYCQSTWDHNAIIQGIG